MHNSSRNGSSLVTESYTAADGLSMKKPRWWTGLFFELSVDYSQEQLVVLKSFVSSVPFEDCSYVVKLLELKACGAKGSPRTHLT